MAAKTDFRRNYKAPSKFAFILILGAVFSLFLSIAARGESAPIFYTVKVCCIRNDIALHVKAGDTVTDAVGKFPLGKIEKVVFTEAKAETYNQEKNEMTLAAVKGYSDIFISVSADGKILGNEAKIGSYTLYSGKRIYFRLPDFSGEGVCVEIDGAAK